MQPVACLVSRQWPGRSALAERISHVQKDDGNGNTCMAQPEHSSSKRQAQHFISLDVKKATGKLRAEAELELFGVYLIPGLQLSGQQKEIFSPCVEPCSTGKARQCGASKHPTPTDLHYPKLGLIPTQCEGGSGCLKMGTTASSMLSRGILPPGNGDVLPPRAPRPHCDASAPFPVSKASYLLLGNFLSGL